MNAVTPERPCLRAVDIFPVRTEQGVGLVLHDRRDIARTSLVVSAGAALVLEQLDGGRTLREIQANILRETGRILPYDQIESLVRTLDENLFLDSDRYRAEFDAIRREWAALPSRPAAHAGSGYPDDPAEAAAFLDELFAGPGGPGRPNPDGLPRDLVALVAPHIDLHRGGATFAHAYRALAERSDAAVFVVLGIAHDGDGRPYAITTKDFETPLGLVRTDRDMAARIVEKAPAEALGDDIAHRREHSVEFQALLLRHCFPDREIAIVPILCGSLHEALAENRPPIEQPEVRGFVDALRNAIARSSRKVAVVAGVDLAHVGRRFGNKRAADEAMLREVEAEDRAMLERVAAGDADGFFRSIQKDLDRRNVCGYPALYTMLCLLDGGAKGSLLDYAQAPEEETGSAVTFAAMSFV